MKKFLIIFVFAGFLLVGARQGQAAKKYVPTPQQLQPQTSNEQPNLSGNVNYQAPVEGGPGQAGSETGGANLGQQSGAGAKTPNGVFSAQNNSSYTQRAIFGWPLFFGLLVIVICCAAGWFLTKKNGKK